MSDSKPSTRGADWTRLLADPDLVAHLGELLQTYRDAPPEKRDEALLEVMRRIKGSPKAAKAASASTQPAQEAAVSSAPRTATPSTSATPGPPFEPDIFTPSIGQDRRRYPRFKCFTVVELRVNGSPTPVWGNLSNTSLGGCLVETPTVVEAGSKIEIGLWVTSGQVWVKGLVLNGIVTRAHPSSGVRVKFSDMEPAERETLRQFLKFVESTTKGYTSDHGYLAQLKR
jgi:hypothetical protein